MDFIPHIWLPHVAEKRGSEEKESLINDLMTWGHQQHVWENSTKCLVGWIGRPGSSTETNVLNAKGKIFGKVGSAGRCDSISIADMCVMPVSLIGEAERGIRAHRPDCRIRAWVRIWEFRGDSASRAPQTSADWRIEEEVGWSNFKPPDRHINTKSNFLRVKTVLTPIHCSSPFSEGKAARIGVVAQNLPVEYR